MRAGGRGQHGCAPGASARIGPSERVRAHARHARATARFPYLVGVVRGSVHDVAEGQRHDLWPKLRLALPANDHDGVLVLVALERGKAARRTFEVTCVLRGALPALADELNARHALECRAVLLVCLNGHARPAETARREAQHLALVSFNRECRQAAEHLLDRPVVRDRQGPPLRRHRRRWRLSTHGTLHELPYSRGAAAHAWRGQGAPAGRGGTATYVWHGERALHRGRPRPIVLLVAAHGHGRERCRRRRAAANGRCWKGTLQRCRGATTDVRHGQRWHRRLGLLTHRHAPKRHR